MSEIENDRRAEAELEQLLHSVGSRVAPPAQLALEVRGAVREEWRRAVLQRKHRRIRVFAAAASIIAAAALIAIVSVSSSVSTIQMAAVSRVDGQVTRDAGVFHAAESLESGADVYVGDTVSTAQDSRAALRIGDGLAFRLDAQSSVRLIAADRLELTRGAIYVDADPAAKVAASFAVETNVGTVRHIGTQYEVRMSHDAIRVSVREGRVAIDRDGVLHSSTAGERIEIWDNGAIERSTLTRADTDWRWVYEVVPGFDIENQTLVQFLNWYTRETGHVVTFANPRVQHDAEQMILRGSIEGLDPASSLNAVLATTTFTARVQPDGSIVIAQQ